MLTSLLMISGFPSPETHGFFHGFYGNLGFLLVFPRPQLPSLASVVGSCGTGTEAVDFLGEKQRDLTEQNFEFNRSEDLKRFTIW